MEEGLVCLAKIAIGLIGSILIALVATGIIYVAVKIVKKIEEK